MEIPTFEGVETLNDIGNDSYPLFARPHIDGVHAMIRHGQLHFIKGDYPFRNISVKQKFADLLEFSRVNHYSMHITFKSDTVDDFRLQGLLSRIDVVTPEEAACTLDGGGNMFSFSDVLPGDLKVFVTDVVIDKYAEKMNIDSRSANLWFINREMGSECIKVLVPKYCVDGDHLDMTLEDYRRSGELFDGVALYSDGSVYTPGDSYSSACAIIIRLSESVELNVLDLAMESKFIERHVPGVANFVVEDGRSSIHEVCLSKLSDRAYDSFMSSNELVEGSKMVAHRVRLRTMQQPEYSHINTFAYASQQIAA